MLLDYALQNDDTVALVLRLRTCHADPSLLMEHRDATEVKEWVAGTVAQMDAGKGVRLDGTDWFDRPLTWSRGAGATGEFHHDGRATVGASDSATPTVSIWRSSSIRRRVRREVERAVGLLEFDGMDITLNMLGAQRIAQDALFRQDFGDPEVRRAAFDLLGLSEVGSDSPPHCVMVATLKISSALAHPKTSVKSPYAGRTFHVLLWFPPDYPFKPMRVVTLPPLYCFAFRSSQRHIETESFESAFRSRDVSWLRKHVVPGKMLSDMLDEQWSPALTMRHVFQQVGGFLLAPIEADVGPCTCFGGINAAQKYPEAALYMLSEAVRRFNPPAWYFVMLSVSSAHVAEEAPADNKGTIIAAKRRRALRRTGNTAVHEVYRMLGSAAFG